MLEVVAARKKKVNAVNPRYNEALGTTNSLRNKRHFVISVGNLMSVH